MKKTIVMSINKKKSFGTLLILTVFTFLLSFNSFSQDGEALFNQNGCGGCHHHTENMTGPALNGVREKWKANGDDLIQWVKNPSEQIEKGVKSALDIQNFDGFEGTVMPQSKLSDEEISAIFDYIDKASAEEALTVSNPVDGDKKSESQESKGIPINFFFVFLVLIISLFFIIRFKNKLSVLTGAIGIFPDAHKIKNYPVIFLSFMFVAALIIYLLTLGLGNIKVSRLFFGVFPYLALAIFLIGSIYRYTQKGFKVSSLSSQFIEGKKLFWGSQPFHWGLLVLFLGHLIAFLFPRTLLAWNGSPIRLLILEISSFAFALLALLGLILLIKRRLTSKSLLVTTNKMDMVVYVVLFTQIISGLGVAFFVRWGSSWFASVLTPYLRSIFKFDPEIAAVSQAPIWIQIHIISAFLIVAIIPFTRFMHFLVAPLDYAWRKYQLVIWNWDRTAIRRSARHIFGKPPRNH